MQRQYRQGDVLLCAVVIVPTAAAVPTTGDRVVAAEGELTGHADAFAASEVALYRDEASGRSCNREWQHRRHCSPGGSPKQLSAPSR